MYRLDTSQRYASRRHGASPRTSAIRLFAAIARSGPWKSGQLSACGQFRRNLSGMRRSVVDYGLARRATLASVFSGRATVTDVCDAHPYLLRAAKFHGEPTGDRCPICRKTNLTHVTYVYGDELGQYEGRVRKTR